MCEGVKVREVVDVFMCSLYNNLGTGICMFF